MRYIIGWELIWYNRKKTYTSHKKKIIKQGYLKCIAVHENREGLQSGLHALQTRLIISKVAGQPKVSEDSHLKNRSQTF